MRLFFIPEALNGVFNYIIGLKKDKDTGGQ
jgi:hypothetical protein